jgi:hypothetical protein
MWLVSAVLLCAGIGICVFVATSEIAPGVVALVGLSLLLMSGAMFATSLTRGKLVLFRDRIEAESRPFGVRRSASIPLGELSAISRKDWMNINGKPYYSLVFERDGGGRPFVVHARLDGAAKADKVIRSLYRTMGWEPPPRKALEPAEAAE